MQTIKTNCFGITITFDPANKANASIHSDMKAESNDSVFNTAVDSLEALILAHHCAGLDITSPAYLEGIETAYEALANNIEEPSDSDMVSIIKTRRIHAIADETIDYEVKQSDWDAAIKEHGSDSTALFALQRDLKVTRTCHDADIVEVLEEHDVEVFSLN